MGDWTKKVGDLGDWATNKVGDGRFGSKMGAQTGRSVEYALGAGRLGGRKVGDLEIQTPPRGPQHSEAYICSL